MGVKQRKVMKKQLKKASAQNQSSAQKKKAVVSDEKTMTLVPNQQSETADFLSLDGGPARKLQSQSPLENNATVLYIGRIPHGFYEKEMEAFFKQFGTIKKLRIARNKKTGKSKHFGFIQFEHPEVAKVVAETMHNYLLSEHILKVHPIPPQHVHPKLWRGFNYLFKPADWVQDERKRHNKERTMEEHRKLIEKIVKKDKKRQKMIQDAGIDYQCPEIVGSTLPAPKKIRFT